MYDNDHHIKHWRSAQTDVPELMSVDKRPLEL